MSYWKEVGDGLPLPHPSFYFLLNCLTFILLFPDLSSHCRIILLGWEQDFLPT